MWDPSLASLCHFPWICLVPRIRLGWTHTEEEDIGGFPSRVCLCPLVPPHVPMTLHSFYGAFSILAFCNPGPHSPCVACKLCRALGLTSGADTDPQRALTKGRLPFPGSHSPGSGCRCTKLTLAARSSAMNASTAHGQKEWLS